MVTHTNQTQLLSKFQFTCKTAQIIIIIKLQMDIVLNAQLIIFPIKSTLTVANLVQRKV